ncbi:uncharacterized protein LOC127845313 [Dreissena polymorpha]|uniref:Chlorophyllase n=1 Tax=Dreissena polymorpha TaxID=45954 RepID=A0A9D4IEX9_DREPO|nr:uncharacterized protein LOC127845313 [Dreissena polymorpha]KAH3771470.1 hypothetical protein DPMN_172789 [Dreissena polymorpha]
MNGFAILFAIILSKGSQGIFIDEGSPYADGPLEVAKLDITVTTDTSPKHVQVFFPQGAGEFAVVYYVGGLNTLVLTELYSIFLSKLASHGLFVFGIDYYFPANTGQFEQDIDIYFKEFDFLRKYMANKTVGVPRWDHTGLLCHSSGCDVTLRMIESRRFPFQSSVFLEAFSTLAHASSSLNFTIPALMYATQLAYEGVPTCNIKGYGFEKFYSLWKCPRIKMEVADFGHCDILDPIGWEACHISHFCKTSNSSRLNEYRQAIQGICASFYVTMLQGRPDAVNYIIDEQKVPVKLLVHDSDWNC